MPWTPSDRELQEREALKDLDLTAAMTSALEQRSTHC